MNRTTCLAGMLLISASSVAVLADDDPPSLSKSPFDVTGKVADNKNDSPASQQGTAEKPSDDQASKDKNPVLDRKQAAARARIERKIEPIFKRATLVSGNSFERAHVDDYFVVALFHMPLATRQAELRFQVTQGVDASTNQVGDYIESTPNAAVRNFQVVSRFKSASDAEAGLQFTRKKYDQYRKYQAQMLTYLKGMQAKSVRRC